MAQIYAHPTHDDDLRTRLRGVARTLRQRRRLRLGLRAVWIALAVWSLGLLAVMLGVNLSPTLLLGAALVTLAACGLYAWISHPSLARLARGLDAHYNLGEQLATALEIARQPESNAVEARLVNETDALLVRMRRYFASEPIIPWREVETFGAVALLAFGLTIASGLTLPTAESPIALPQLPPPTAPTAATQPTPTAEPVKQEQPQLSPQDQAAANAIADALRDNGATRSAADALAQGDTQGAARDLRRLADQADQLGEQARRDLAQGLRDAAGKLRESQPGVADQLEQEADGLQRGGQDAQQALEDLARTVENLGKGDQVAQGQQQNQGQPSDQNGQQPGQQQGQQQRQPGGQAGSGAGNQLGGEQRGAQNGGTQAQGDTLPLPEASNKSGPTTDATGPKGPTVELQAGGTGSTQQGGGNNSNQQISSAADPLSIPSEYRDVVEDYFSPRP